MVNTTPRAMSLRATGQKEEPFLMNASKVVPTLEQSLGCSMVIFNLEVEIFLWMCVKK